MKTDDAFDFVKHAFTVFATAHDSFRERHYDDAIAQLMQLPPFLAKAPKPLSDHLQALPAAIERLAGLIKEYMARLEALEQEEKLCRSYSETTLIMRSQGIPSMPEYLVEKLELESACKYAKSLERETAHLGEEVEQCFQTMLAASPR